MVNYLIKEKYSIKNNKLISLENHWLYRWIDRYIFCWEGGEQFLNDKDERNFFKGQRVKVMKKHKVILQHRIYKEYFINDRICTFSLKVKFKSSKLIPANTL